MFAATTGQRPPGRRHFMVALECGKALVTAVARVNVDDHEPIGHNAEVGLWHEVPEPVLSDTGFGGGGKQAVRRKFAVGMLCGTAAWLAAAVATARAD